MTIVYTLSIIFGVLMSIGHFPQAWTMYRHKSGENVSLVTYLIFAAGTLIWLIYGIMIADAPIITSYLLGVVGSWLVLILKIYYGNRKIEKKP